LAVDRQKVDRKETSVSDTYLGATETELPGALSGAAATHVVQRAGARIMRQRLTAALILATMIVICVSGCRSFVVVHTSPARHSSTAGR
jgi:hypothetical protein